MHAGAHTQGHEAALEETIHQEQSEITFEIGFPFGVDMDFTNRDDWGNAGNGEPITIGNHQADTNEFHVNNQLVWILHLELTETWRPNYLAEPMSPGGFRNMSAYA